MKLLSRFHRWFLDSPIRTKLVLVFAFTMFMVAFVNIYMHVSINNVVGTIDKEDAYVLSVKLQVAPDAEAKPQLLAIKLSYEGTKNRSDFEETASVSIPVQQKARVRINDPVVYDDPWVGSNVSVGLTLYNLGKSTLYNCMVDVVGDGVTLEESYFGGNIAAGGTMRGTRSNGIRRSLPASSP